MSNIRVEVTDHIALYIDAPELTMRGISKPVSVEFTNFPACRP